jgi:branched-chain amino acid transport system permease protein
MWVTTVISGLCTGSLFGLVSAAFSFQIGALRMLNFAYGAFVMIGMYLMYGGIHYLGWHIAVVVPVLVIFYFFAGCFLRATLLKRVLPSVQIIVTAGISLVVESLVLYTAGAMPRSLFSGILPAWRFELFGHGLVVINMLNVLTFVVSTVVLLGFSMFLKRTWLGMTIRAVVQQKEAASLMGIDAEKIINIGFGISFIMTSIASIIISLQFVLEPSAGHYYQLIGFLVCVIAGIGNLKGGFFAGLLVGLISTVVSVYIAAWHDPIIFVLFVFVLIYLPHGVFVSKKSLTRAV